jgi:hypothetical protein
MGAGDTWKHVDSDATGRERVTHTWYIDGQIGLARAWHRTARPRLDPIGLGRHSTINLLDHVVRTHELHHRSRTAL